jgi:putative toxin-antitoxin system antitoxin component (TIGR02293 family)
MKKHAKLSKKPSIQKSEKQSKLNEPVVPNRVARSIPQLKEFNYTEFKKIAEKVPLSQSEWASILHLSERTLQRYAKSNSNFAPLNAERALQIEKVMKEGKITFGNTLNFYNWLKRKPTMLEGVLSIDSLSSFDGIEKVLTQLGRIQHGLFA